MDAGENRFLSFEKPKGETTSFALFFIDRKKRRCYYKKVANATNLMRGKSMKGLMRHINTTSRCAVQYKEECFKEKGLNGYQSSYILHVCASPGIAQEELARHLHVNKSNVTRQLALLEESGYVTRRQSEDDKRQTLVYPTQLAYDILPYAHKVHDDWNAYLAADLTEQERAAFLSIMGKVADKAEHYQEWMAQHENNLF